MGNIAGTNSQAYVRKFILPFFKIIFSIGYGSFLMYALFFARRRRNLTEHFLNLKPIKGTIDNYRHIDPEGNHETFHFYTNLLGNIFLFIPLPVILLCLAVTKSTGRTMLIAFAVSVLVELLQFIFYRGVADIDDILLNLIGAGIGIMIYKHLIEKWEARMIN